jgi:hypothetical protein
VRPTCITGMHRTGTSLVARSLRAAGLHLGPDEVLVPPAPDNPEGFFEHEGLVRLNDDLLEAVGGAWDHPPDVPPLAADDPRVAHLREPARRLLAELAGQAAWGWKDPRVSLTARFWLDLIDDVQFVICLRHPLEVALSLKQRNRSSYAHGLALWFSYYDRLLDAVPADRRVVTHYDAHFDDPSGELQRLAIRLDLPGGAPADLSSQVRTELRHQRVAIGLAEAGVGRATIELYDLLCAEAGRPRPDPGNQADHASVQRAVVELAAARQLLEQRRRQVESLERERVNLSDRVAELERAVESYVDADLGARLSSLEDAVVEVGYRAEDLSHRDDADQIRGVRRLVRARTDRHDPLLVLAKGDPALLDLYGRPTTNLPADEHGRYPGFAPSHATAAVAQLEAARAAGARYLVVPESARWWLDHYTAFAEHLLGRYRVVADEPGAGLLVDLTSRLASVDGHPRSLSETLDRLATSVGRQPAVLDLTTADLVGRLPDRNVFVPPPSADGLPFLDGSVDVVVVDDAGPAAEARRVGALAVISVDAGAERAPTVTDVELLDADQITRALDRLTVVLAGEADLDDGRWSAHLHEALAEETGVEVVSPDADSAVVDAAAGSDLVALVSPGVVPLPGCLACARRALGRDATIGAVAVKLVGGDGTLVSAGSTVFADGSVAEVAAGSHEVAAPWHEYVRPTCGGAGLLIARLSALEKAAGDEPVPGPRSLVAWCGRLWSAGSAVQYRPDATAVLLRPPTGDEAEPSDELRAAWRPALAARPARPTRLDTEQWRSLLATDDVEASWS